MKKSVPILFITGGIVGSLLDGQHTHSDTAFYTHPFFWKMAWWTPLIFGGATLLIAFSHFKIFPRLKDPKRAFLGSLFFFAAAYFISAWLPTGNLMKGAVMLALYVFSWGLFDRTGQSIFLAIPTAIIGTSVESWLGHQNVFVYAHPDYFLVPIWLPVLYLHASAAGGYLGRLVFGQKEG